MRSILQLCKLYLLGSLRRQAHLATLFLAVILFMLPAYVNALSLGLNAFQRVATDFGLTIIGYYSVGLAVFLGSTAVPREVENRSLYPILARPMSRGGYLAAHFLSIIIILTGSIVFLGFCLSVSLSLLTRQAELMLFGAAYGYLLQAAVIAAICMMFSVKCSPALAGTIGLASFVVGSLSTSFIHMFLLDDRGSQTSAGLAKLLKSVVPNLAVFSLKDPVVHHLPIPAGYYLSMTYYGLVWMVLILLIAQLLFQRVDL